MGVVQGLPGVPCQIVNHFDTMLIAHADSWRGCNQLEWLITVVLVPSDAAVEPDIAAETYAAWC